MGHIAKDCFIKKREEQNDKGAVAFAAGVPECLCDPLKMNMSDPSKTEQQGHKRTIGELYPGTHDTEPIYMTVIDCSDNHDDVYENDMHCDEDCMMNIHDNEHKKLMEYQIEQEMYDYIANLNTEENSDKSAAGTTFSNPIPLDKNYNIVYEDDSFNGSELTNEEPTFDDDSHGEKQEEQQLVAWCNEASLKLNEGDIHENDKWLRRLSTMPHETALDRMHYEHAKRASLHENQGLDVCMISVDVPNNFENIQTDTNHCSSDTFTYAYQSPCDTAKHGGRMLKPNNTGNNMNFNTNYSHSK
jgi:hypothetical protein